VSGLGKPAYVLDIPGATGKVPVGAELRRRDVVEDINGVKRDYR